MATYKGQKATNVNTKVVVLKKGGVDTPFFVSSQTPGFQDRLQALGLMVRPQPPKVLQTGPGGRPLRDSITNQHVYNEDESNPDYVAALNLWHARFTSLVLRDYLRGDSNLAFDAVEPNVQEIQAWQVYADKLTEEFYGPEGLFTDLEGAYLLREGKLLGVVSVDADEEVPGFLGQPRS